MAEIRIENLHKSFADFVAVRQCSLNIADGKFVVLLGPSGCGKTTTLRMIAGLEFPTSGQILLGGEDVTYLRPRHRDIAMVFQLFALYPHMRVRQNLAFPLQNEGLPRSEIERRIAHVAEILRIGEILDCPVGGLSGGDRQRIALGRAIVRHPKAFLMDEPLGTLDAEFRELMCVELRRLHNQIGTTTVFVTHDQNEAMALADMIVVMNRGDILQADSPERIYNFPASKFVANFIGQPAMNFLKLDQPVRCGTAMVRVGGAQTAVAEPLADAAEGLLGVRPEHVAFAADGPLAGEIVTSEYFGSHHITTVATSAGPIKVHVPKGERPLMGSNVRLKFNSQRVVLFDSRTELLIPNRESVQKGACHV